jgi:prepilin-type N-terminal cleavage/methylation domain-containing protein
MTDRPAFTLIEILVVIAIVAMMAVIAIANYGSVRQGAKMDYTADALVNLVNQQQSAARSGKMVADADVEGKTVCYGVIFSKEKPYVQTVQAPYISVDIKIDQNNADFCNMKESVPTPFEQFEDNTVSKIEKFGLPVSDITIMFRPPEARISLGSEKLEYQNDSTVNITFQSVSGKDVRSFTIDMASGLVERVGTGASKPVTGTKVVAPGRKTLPISPIKTLTPTRSTIVTPKPINK